jgi:hypothetical protein
MKQSGISTGAELNTMRQKPFVLHELMLTNEADAPLFKDIDMDMVDLMLLFTWGLEC